MPTMQFRLAVSTHACNDSFKGTCPKCRKVGDLVALECAGCKYKMVPAAGWVPIERAYKAGDLIETTQDLDKLNGDIPPKKFERMVGGQPVAVAAKSKVVDIGEMTLEELRLFSEEEELGVDFEKLKTADDARKAVRAARKATA